MLVLVPVAPAVCAGGWLVSGTLAVELALVKSLELLLGWTLGGPVILGLRTWGEPLEDTHTAGLN